MLSYLPKYEICFYITVYIGALVVGFCHLYLASEELAKDEENTHFENGWKLFNRKRDDLDFEWEAFTLFIEKYIYWFICHAAISEIVRFTIPSKIPLTHAIIGFAFIFFNFNKVCYLLLFLMLLSYYIVMRSTKQYIWSITVLWLILLNVIKQDEVQEYLFAYNNAFYMYEVIILSCWIILRLISFSVDYANARIGVMRGEKALEVIQERFSTWNFFAYVLYVPTILIGPPFMYERYEHMIEMNKQDQRVEEFLTRLSSTIQSLLRVWFWWIVNNLMLHFFYTNNFTYNAQHVQALNIWAFYGLAFSMGQYFFNKYTVSYGFGIAAASFDRINAPGRPRCVAYIHLYSNMWRYFDQGLHEFLFNYIYAEVRADSTSKAVKYFASFMTFNFIFFWHGCYQFILLWSIMNFICLHFEQFGKRFVQSDFYNKYITCLGTQNCYRLNAVAGSQLYILAVLSNMIFIGGMDVGILMIKRTYFEIGLLAYVILSFCCYCLYHSSEFIWRCERESDKMKQEKVQ